MTYSNICTRMSACAYQGRVVPHPHFPPHHNGHLSVVGEPLCCIHLAPICWQWAKSRLPSLPTSKCRHSEPGYLANKIGFYYLCGFAFLKINSVVPLVFFDFPSPACCTSPLLFPHFQKSWFCPYCYKYSPPFLSLVAFLAMNFSLGLLVKYLLPA